MRRKGPHLLPPFPHAVVAIVYDKQCAVVSYNYGYGIVELASTVTAKPKARQENTISYELLNGMIIKIGDKDISFGTDCDAGDGRKPAIDGAVNVCGKRTAPSVRMPPLGLNAWMRSL